MELQNTDTTQDNEFEKGLRDTILNQAKAGANEAKSGGDDELAKRVPTFTMSTCASADTLMPTNLAEETLNAFLKLKSEDVNFDEFVMNKLKYPTKLAMCNAFNAEQVDAVALAIYQIEKGKSLIVGDMAGIGKGRIAAGILRYAYLNKKVPVFITERPNLFSDIYRDISAIGGFGLRVSGNVLYPTPLILNGYKPKGENAVIDPKTKTIKFDAQKNDEIIRVLEESVNTGNFPLKTYQLILATYSQFSVELDNNGNDKLKVKYLKEIANNCIFILDESHNAVGVNSGTGRFFREIAIKAGGCTFLSATAAKRAEHLQLYGIRTDIMDSTARDTKTLLEIIKKGGEPMQEYLSSSLAEVGQMIRRERSFENCPIEFDVIPQENNEIFNLYDNTIKAYNKILSFMKDVASSSASDKLVERIIERVTNNYPDSKFEITKETRPKSDEELEAWYVRNEGKYEYFLDFKAVKSTRFNVIDTLVMAIKAEYVAKMAVSQLTKTRLYKYLDGSTRDTTIKPIIAVRNTLDNLWDKIGIKIDDEVVTPDFKLILEAALKTALNGNVRFKKVIYETDDERKDRKKKENKSKKKTKNQIPNEFSENDVLIYSDFNDNGAELKNLETFLANFVSGLFVSPIDKLIQIIESAPRPAEDKHGEGSRFLRVAEVSGRKRRLRYENGKWYLRSISKAEEDKEVEDRNTFQKFDGFNNGKYDALIINEVGSTGASAQASKEYKDSRPRAMIIHQVELDVNTEVQKRGRVNRTGQICLPTYTYLTSPIPSEIRRLLMLKRKLRSLDSLTTGSQKQSDELVMFKNKKGKVIQDFYNYIGLDVLNNWLTLTENSKFDKFFYNNADHVSLRNRENGDEKFVDDFCRIMELAESKIQEEFYDSINDAYIEEVDKLISEDNFLLETTVEDLQASLKAKGETKFGLNTSPFNSSVYDEENYVFIKNVPYTKSELNSLIDELCLGMTPKEYHEELKSDYLKEFDDFITNTINEEYPLPKREDYATKEAYQKALIEVESAKQDRITREIENSTKVFAIIEKYIPDEDYIVPDYDDFTEWMDEYQSTHNNAKPDANKEPSLILKSGKYYEGKFVGYRPIPDKAKFKYSAGSIEMIFAFVGELKKVILKPTPKYMDLLQWIPIRTSFMYDEQRVKINEWDVEKKKRTTQRFLTGNVIDALRIAESRKKQGIITSYKYTKFTTDNNDIRNGVHLKFGENYVPLKIDEIETSIPSVTKAFADQIEAMSCTTEGSGRSSRYICDYALSMNSGYTERFYSVELGGEKLLKFIVIGEKLKRDANTGGYKAISKGEKFVSKFYKDKNIERFIKSAPVQKVEELIDYSLVKQQTQYFNIEQYIITDDSDKKGLFDYLYEIDKSSYKFRQGTSSPENVRFLKDAFEEKAGEETTKEGAREEGNFEYFNIEMYEPQDKNIPFYVSHRKGEFQYIITTRKMLTPIETIQFSLNPYNLTENQMAANFFSKFDRREQEDIIKQINFLYQGSDNNFYKVGTYVAKLCKERYASANYIFGKLAKNASIIGEIMYNYVNSEEVLLRMASKQEAEEIKKEEYVVEIKPMTESNVQDYLILLNT